MAHLVPVDRDANDRSLVADCLLRAPSTTVLHPTKEGQFPRDPIFFGQIPIF